MRKKIQIVLIIFVFALCSVTLFAQSKATTPAKNSLVRKSIIAVVKKKFGKTQADIENPDVLKVQANWARIIYDVEGGDGDEGSTGVNLLLRKTGGVWKIIFDYNQGDGEDPDDYFKGIPRGVYNSWDN